MRAAGGASAAEGRRRVPHPRGRGDRGRCGAVFATVASAHTAELSLVDPHGAVFVADAGSAHVGGFVSTEAVHVATRTAVAFGGFFAPRPFSTRLKILGVAGDRVTLEAPVRDLVGCGPKAPKLRVGTISVNGRLPPEVIERTARQNFGRFRVCYEDGLRRDATLSGRIGTKLVIGRQGKVVSTADGGSDLPDPAVVACVVHGFSNLSFPAPEGGIVTVLFPIIFSPGQ